MTENNDKLLENFFAENRQEVADNGADNGFSRRVMRQLPNRSNRLARLWTAGGFTLAAVLFVLMDGLQLIWDTLRETFTTTVANGMEQADPRSIVIALGVLLFLMYRKIASLA